MHGWQMAAYAAMVVAVLVLGSLRLNAVLARRKRNRGPQLVIRPRPERPEGRLMNAQSRDISNAPSMEARVRRGLKLVR